MLKLAFISNFKFLCARFKCTLRHPPSCPASSRVNIPQEIEIPGRRQPHIADSGPVNTDIVVVPQANVGRVFRDIFLNRTEKFPPLFPVDLRACAVHQGIQRRIAITPPVGSSRRNVSRVKGKIEKLGIAVNPNPPKRRELEASSVQIRN